MGKLMTADEFGEKKVDLVRAIELAEGEYHSASFKLSTGSGDADGVTSAKAHLAALQGQLEDLEAAWVATEAASVREYAADKATAFDQFRTEVDGLLAARRAAVTAAREAGAAMVAAISQYQDASRSIRAKAVPFHCNAGASCSNALLGLNAAVDEDTWTARLAASTALGDARISLTPGQLSSECFGSLGALGFEDRVAKRVRSAVLAFAPKSEEV